MILTVRAAKTTQAPVCLVCHIETERQPMTATRCGGQRTR